MHCDLEHVPGFQFLAWCHSQDAAPQQDADCGGDTCSEVESALYSAGTREVTVPLPLLALSFLLPMTDDAPMTSVSEPLWLTESPPELSRAWQFSYRTALPPRAPSLVA
jgi:hypothetical protein